MRLIKTAAYKTHLLILVTLALLASCAPHAALTVMDGDIIFQTSKSSQSLAIQRATGSRYSHMGLILMRAGKPFVFEAVSPVKYTPLEQWIARGAGGHYVVKRLKNAATLLTPDALRRLSQAAGKFTGRPYDLGFAWSDDRMYCSEIVWKLFDRVLDVQVGELQKIRDFNLSDPAVRAKMRERYGAHIPLEEPVISPGAMFDSKVLVMVGEG